MKRDVFKEALAEPRVNLGAPIPLFERLIDNTPDEDTEAPVKRFYNRFELIQSIQREVERILNTRANAKKLDHTDLAEDMENFALPQLFGLPDCTFYDAANSDHRLIIGRMCAQAITAYEPRLRNVKVQITGFDKTTQTLEANIAADLNVQNFQGEVTFPINFNTL